MDLHLNSSTIVRISHFFLGWDLCFLWIERKVNVGNGAKMCSQFQEWRGGWNDFISLESHQLPRAVGREWKLCKHKAWSSCDSGLSAAGIWMNKSPQKDLGPPSLLWHAHWSTDLGHLTIHRVYYHLFINMYWYSIISVKEEEIQNTQSLGLNAMSHNQIQ